ncbi:hypothetical protein AV656_12010 [Bhargavaea cecembensis]|uniref:YugN-like family protein n=1 Tax=Bhargavaea cecembensis TaxID=394098 RepID=A0A163EVK2_9BACL|nr:YugN family protein [Bhargavaea cecembensis]KZE37287.1 hypothetical protein AV656_12010 [Bhargavaea cecembensis]
MLKLETDLQGKQARFGDIYPILQEKNLTLGGNWDYDEAIFDGILYKEGPETIYLRIPFDVTSGMLEDPDTQIVFGQPFVLKHVANVGLDHEGDDLLATTGLNQFQSPEEKDGPIRRKSHWEEEGERVVQGIVESFPLLDERNIG